MRTKLYAIWNDIHRRGMMINDFKHGLIVTLPKKKGTMKFEKHRTINLTSKILCRVIKIRIESKIHSNVGNSQFGFRKNIGTREAILSENFNKKN